MRVIFKKNTVTVRCCFYVLPEDETNDTDYKEKKRKLNLCCFYVLLNTCKTKSDEY